MLFGELRSVAIFIMVCRIPCEVPSYVSTSLTATSATQPCRTHIRPPSFAGCAGSWAELKHSRMGWANAAIGFAWTVEMFSIQITKRANAEAAVGHTTSHRVIGHGMRQGWQEVGLGWGDDAPPATRTDLSVHDAQNHFVTWMST